MKGARGSVEGAGVRVSPLARDQGVRGTEGNHRSNSPKKNTGLVVLVEPQHQVIS